MNSKQLRDASDWAKQQAKQLQFVLPDKRPDEEAATEKQIQYIRVLVKSINETQLADLGKWQASALIDHIKTEKEIYTHELAETYLGNDSGAESNRSINPIVRTSKGLFIALFIFAIAIAITYFVFIR